MTTASLCSRISAGLWLTLVFFSVPVAFILLFVLYIDPLMYVHTASCRVTNLRFTQTAPQNGDTCDYNQAQAFNCSECNPLFAPCCSHPNSNKATCLEILVAFRSEFGSEYQVLPTTNRIDCGTDILKQYDYRALLYPSAVFPCHWSEFRPQWSVDSPPTKTPGVNFLIACAVVFSVLWWLILIRGAEQTRNRYYSIEQ